MSNRTGRTMRLIAGGVLGLSGLAFAPSAGAAVDTSAFCANVPSGESGFTDIADAGTHADNVECLAFSGITSGTTATTYSPQQNVTRGQMATFIANMIDTANELDAAGAPALNDLPTAAASADAFTDDEGNTHEDNINRLAQAGVVAGTSATTFNPNGNVSRAQMASFIAQGIEFLTGTALPEGTDAFTDDETSVHEANINRLATAEIVSGQTATTYNPSGLVSRAQMGSFIIQGLAALHADGIINPLPAAGAETASERPELVSAQILNTVTAAQASPSNPAGTRVRFVFDESIAGASPVAGNFYIYTFQDAGGGDFSGTSAFVDTAATNSVIVNFGGADTAAEIAQASLGALEEGAVADLEGNDNIEGNAPIGTAGSTGLAAGVTAAPDLVSVGTFRESAGGGVAVDITFDEAAFAAAVPAAGDFLLVPLANATGNPAACLGPADPSATASGGTAVGGNGTATWTIICEGGPTVAVWNASTVARVVVTSGVVDDATGGGGSTNPLQAADVAGSGNANDPSLVSAQFFPNGTSPDQVLYTFSEPVNLVADPSALFMTYDALGTETPGTALTAQRSPSVETQVLVTFPDGTLNQAVGASVLGDAVVESTGGTTNNNEEDEVGVANSNTTSLVPGRTTAADLVQVVRNSTTNAFNQTIFSITYVFDEDVDPLSVNASDYSIFLPSGAPTDVFRGGTCTAGGTEDTDHTVTCTAFALASNSVIGAAAVGSVNYGAVEDAGDGIANPEAFDVISNA